MKKIFSKFKSKRAHSVSEALEQILGAEKALEIVRGAASSRFYLTEAAEKHELDEGKLYAKVAELLGISFEQYPQLPTTWSSSFSNDILIESGTIPLDSGAKTPSYFTNDPALSQRYFEGIAEWKAVLVSPTALENLLTPGVIVVAPSAIAEVMGDLLKFCEQYNAAELEIEIAESAIEYCLETGEGKSGRGQIGEQHRDLLQSFLKKDRSELVADLKSCLSAQSVLSSMRIASISDSTLLIDFRAQEAEEIVEELEEQELEVSEEQELVQEVPHASEMKEAPADSLLAQARAEESTIEIEADEKPHGVLLVDDSEAFRSVLSRFLGKQGIECVCCESAAEALELLEGGYRPEMVISDMHMPFMNGVEFVTKLRTVAGMTHTPIMALTSDDDRSLEEDMFRAGVDNFADKASPSSLIIAKVERMLERERSLRVAA